MNIFEIVFLNIILLLFPLFIYLIYLGSNKNINEKNKTLYFIFSLITAIYLINNYQNSNTLIAILSYNFILILLYIESKYKTAMIFSIILIIINFNKITNIYFIVYILLLVIYILKSKFKFSDYIFISITNIIISIILFFICDLKQAIYLIAGYVFIMYITKIIYDISKRMLSLNKTLKELESEKQIKLSLFKITHEIKNPIAVCKGYLDMLDVKNENQVERYVPILKSEIDRLLSLLQDFLSINKCNLDIDIMDVNMLVEDTCDKLKPLLEENGINLNLDLIDDDIYINGDYNRLSQVLINIVKNSIEALGNDGNIIITSNIKNNKCYLEIKDNGCGMDKEVLEKIKEPFFTTKKRGAGLGVSLIYEIIEAHNAKISYSSEYNKGTTVNLVFSMYR